MIKKGKSNIWIVYYFIMFVTQISILLIYPDVSVFYLGLIGVISFLIPWTVDVRNDIGYKRLFMIIHAVLIIVLLVFLHQYRDVEIYLFSKYLFAFITTISPMLQRLYGRSVDKYIKDSTPDEYIEKE